jgi:DNA processing protein
VRHPPPQPSLPLGPAGALPAPARAISPFLDLGAYEVLWTRPGASFRRLAALFREHPGALPSDLVQEGEARAMARQVVARLARAGISSFGVRIHGSPEYPRRLRDAASPPELLTYQGCWSLVERPAIAVVGTREPSAAALARTRQLVSQLVEAGFTIASGLAAGIDTAAHRAALAAGGRTFAVIGTPLGSVYPPENAPLQRHLARHQLVVSPVPVELYHRQTWSQNRHFFPARGAVLSALSIATLVVEAGDGSGTLTTARAALRQHRPLLVLAANFTNPRLTWPARYRSWGALPVHDLADILQALPLRDEPASPPDDPGVDPPDEPAPAPSSEHYLAHAGEAL